MNNQAWRIKKVGDTACFKLKKWDEKKLTGTVVKVTINQKNCNCQYQYDIKGEDGILYKDIYKTSLYVTKKERAEISRKNVSKYRSKKVRAKKGTSKKESLESDLYSQLKGYLQECFFVLERNLKENIETELLIPFAKNILSLCKLLHEMLQRKKMGKIEFHYFDHIDIALEGE